MRIQCVCGHEFHEICASVRGSNNIANRNTNIKPGFPSFADEVAEPCPDINIKVAAFTAIKEFYYTLFYLPDQLN